MWNLIVDNYMFFFFIVFKYKTEERSNIYYCFFFMCLVVPTVLRAIVYNIYKNVQAYVCIYVFMNVNGRRGFVEVLSLSTPRAFNDLF